MKKFLAVCMICFLTLFISYNLWLRPDILKSIVRPVAEKVEEYTQEDEIPYTSDFKVNDININNDEFYYNTLDENKKAIYKSLANAVKELKTEFKIQDYVFTSVDTAMDDAEVAMHKFLLDHPEVFYLNEKYSIATSQSILSDDVTLKVSYTVSGKEELDGQINEILNAIQVIGNEAKIGEDSIFEQELRLHDVLAKKVKYYNYETIESIPHNAHNIYGAFVEKVAVCDGMAKALQVLFDKINVDSIVVTGMLDNEAHAWNKVKLNNKWYNVDMTSNKSIKDYEGMVIHSYFNITDNEILKTHKFDEVEGLPTANSVQCNYFLVMDKVINSSDNFDEKLDYIIRNNKDPEKVEYRVENVTEIPEKSIKLLRNKKHYMYLDESLTKFLYYNVLDNYIIVKR